ncbi:MAG: serine hydrolase domain-containing protein [Bacillota bacterium]
MKRPILVILLSFILAWSFIFSGCSSEKAETVEKETTEEITIKTQLQELLDEHDKKYEFSASVLIAKDGEVLIRKGYGMADYFKGIPNKPDTIFSAGSITKQFTAAAVMLLQERGLLNVQDTVDKYIPDYPEGDKIKLFNLLTNTSGIRDYIQDNGSGKYHTPEEIISIFKDKPLEFKPGERFNYCNSSYFLLGYIIEKASGMKYEEYMKKHIFEPLEMHNTGFDFSWDTAENVAKGYTSTQAQAVETIYVDPSFAYAAGAVQTTVEDMYKWNQALYTEKLLKNESIKEMFTPYLSGYAYGWIIHKDEASHGGGINGYRSYFERNTQENYAIIILGNSDNDTSSIVVRKIKQLLSNAK